MSKSTYRGGNKSFTTEEFIERAKKVHGNKYDYSKVDYKNCNTKVAIICKEHGKFLQTPSNHLSGYGCQTCGIKNRAKTNAAYLKQIKSIHGSKYDYSKVKYKTVNDLITIICPIHGEFKTPAGRHLKGQGCPKCGVRSRHQNQPKSSDLFISQSRKIHGNRYDYSKVVYKNGYTKVTIICPEHGEFLQTPGGHIAGRRCPGCSGGIRSTTKNFISKSKKLHKNHYDYSKVVYKNNHTKVKIICPIHGEFLQTPGNHLSGSGCPKCANLLKGCSAGFDRTGDTHPGFLYFLTCKLGNDYFCKIGTAYDTKRRFKSFPFEIVDSLIIPGIIGPLSIIEEKIKKDFEEYRYVPKVKFGGGRKECFQISVYQKILGFLKESKLLDV